MGFYKRCNNTHYMINILFYRVLYTLYYSIVYYNRKQDRNIYSLKITFGCG
jgi:hypothetical protein